MPRIQPANPNRKRTDPSDRYSLCLPSRGPHRSSRGEAAGPDRARVSGADPFAGDASEVARKEQSASTCAGTAGGRACGARFGAGRTPCPPKVLEGAIFVLRHIGQAVEARLARPADGSGQGSDELPGQLRGRSFGSQTAGAAPSGLKGKSRQ
ncbi:uncharacterized protein A4U43_UnF6360 [Asparagus officinalis]|uniref:Uncharacterized protein n=1 Tax=Asparagus officinalis TaxID=4686 RepID=A0A1R3L6H4_ASPOF|nr:uncharacterized protein A4U43_UnF6360 [Asparagus officinalis]